MERKISTTVKKFSIILLSIITLLLMWVFEDMTDYSYGGHLMLLLTGIGWYYTMRFIWQYGSRHKKKKHPFIQALKIVNKMNKNH